MGFRTFGSLILKYNIAWASFAPLHSDAACGKLISSMQAPIILLQLSPQAPQPSALPQRFSLPTKAVLFPLHGFGISATEIHPQLRIRPTATPQAAPTP